MAEDKDAETAVHFLSLAESLKDLATKMDEANKKGEPIDVFASFQEAIGIIQKPVEPIAEETESVQ